MPSIRPATAEDAEFLAPRLRQADKAELLAGSGTSPLDALMEGLRLSAPALVGVDDDDVPILMFGVAPIDDTLGCVWMLSSDDIYKHKFTFLKRSKRVLDDFNKKWPVLFNVCDERNVDHIEWMRRLGYTFIARHPNYGQAGIPFIEFVRVNFHV